MDQLRKAWAMLARHHFWVLVVLATVIAVFFWYSGASALSQQFAENKSKIETQFSAISSLQSTPFKPNESVNAKQQEQIDAQLKSVNALWHELYDRQRAEVLQWPSNLSEEFRRHVEALKFGDDIPRDLRDHYNNYVRDHFPELPKIVGALLAPEGEAGASGRGGYSSRMMTGMREVDRGVGGDLNQPLEEEEDFIVEWLDQPMVRDQLYMATTPSAKRIWKTQEDVWVYEALLKIIASTNKAAGADRFSNAPVRVIETLEVGSPAAAHSRSRNRLDLRPSVGSPGGEVMGGGEFAGEMDRGAATGGGEYGGDFTGENGGGALGGEGDAAADAALFANRYVGEDGKPMATEPTAADEFKRLPVRLRLWMDERWLPNLIAECANAPLQVDVQEVRINPSESGSGGGGRGMSDFGSHSMSGQPGEAMVPEREPHMKTVVIQGIIYIFNPPTEATAADAAGQMADSL